MGSESRKKTEVTDLNKQGGYREHVFKSETPCADLLLTTRPCTSLGVLQEPLVLGLRDHNLLTRD